MSPKARVFWLSNAINGLFRLNRPLKAMALQENPCLTRFWMSTPDLDSDTGMTSPPQSPTLSQSETWVMLHSAAPLLPLQNPRCSQPKAKVNWYYPTCSSPSFPPMHRCTISIFWGTSVVGQYWLPQAAGKPANHNDLRNLNISYKCVERTYQSVLSKTKGTLAPRCPMQMFRLARSDSGSSFLSAMMVFRTSRGWHMICINFALHYLFLQILAGLAYPVSGDHLAGISRLKHIAQWCSMSLKGRVQNFDLAWMRGYGSKCTFRSARAQSSCQDVMNANFARLLHITKYISYFYIICQSCLGFIATVKLHLWNVGALAQVTLGLVVIKPFPVEKVNDTSPYIHHANSTWTKNALHRSHASVGRTAGHQELIPHSNILKWAGGKSQYVRGRSMGHRYRFS